MGFNRILLLILVFLLFVCVGVLYFISENYKDKSKVTKYSWEPRPCTPQNFSIHTDCFYVTYGSDMAAGVMRDHFFGGMAVDWRLLHPEKLILTRWLNIGLYRFHLCQCRFQLFCTGLALTSYEYEH